MRLFDRATENDGALVLAEIFLCDGLDVFTFYGEESVENCVDELRLIIEKREACKEMHQAIAWHASAAAFERGVIVGTEFYFELIEFVLRDAALLDFANHGIKLGEGGVAREFGLVQDFGDHLRGAVVAEDVLDAAVDLDGDLFFENEMAVHASGAAAV